MLSDIDYETIPYIVLSWLYSELLILKFSNGVVMCNLHI